MRTINIQNIIKEKIMERHNELMACKNKKKLIKEIENDINFFFKRMKMEKKMIESYDILLSATSNDEVFVDIKVIYC